MRVLFIGGTGNISVSVSKLAVERGFDLYLLNRGRQPVKIDGTKTIQADINQPAQVRDALGDRHFDVVVNWIAFHEPEIERDLARGAAVPLCDCREYASAPAGGRGETALAEGAVGDHGDLVFLTVRD